EREHRVTLTVEVAAQGGSDFAAHFDLSLICIARNSGSGMWHTIVWPASSRRAGGTSRSHTEPTLRGQRVWNGQPLGGSAADGTGPSRRIGSTCASGSGTGIAERSASV